MSLIQIGLTALFVLAIARAVGALRARQMGWRRCLAWVALWVAALVVVWQPDIASALARTVGVGRGADAVLYLTVALLTYLVFRLYGVVEKQDQTITRLVSELALREGQQQKMSGQGIPLGDAGQPATGR